MIGFETVKNVIVDTLGCEEQAVTEEATLKDLGADSLAAVELMMAMEEATGVTISGRGHGFFADGRQHCGVRDRARGLNLPQACAMREKHDESGSSGAAGTL